MKGMGAASTGEIHKYCEYFLNRYKMNIWIKSCLHMVD